MKTSLSCVIAFVTVFVFPLLAQDRNSDSGAVTDGLRPRAVDGNTIDRLIADAFQPGAVERLSAELIMYEKEPEKAIVSWLRFIESCSEPWVLSRESMVALPAAKTTNSTSDLQFSYRCSLTEPVSEKGLFKKNKELRIHPSALSHGCWIVRLTFDTEGVLDNVSLGFQVGPPTHGFEKKIE